jgi:hypothetical protein
MFCCALQKFIWFSCFPLLQGQTPLFPRIFGHEAGGYASHIVVFLIKSFDYLICYMM